MQTRSHIITPPSQHRILINDFTSNSEAFEAATKSFMVCLPSCPSRASKEDTRPQREFLCLPSRLSSFLMNHSFSYPCCITRLASACVCKGSARNHLQRCASKTSRPSHRRKAKSVFSDRKCLYGASDRGFAQILRGIS